MGTKGSYSYSLMSCFSYTACFSNSLFCIVHLMTSLWQWCSTYREKQLQLGLAHYEERGKRVWRAPSTPLPHYFWCTNPQWCTHQMSCLDAFGYIGPQRLELLLCTNRQLLVYPHFLFGHNFTLTCRHTQTTVYSAIHCIPWVLWVLYCSSSHAACVEMQKSLCTSSHLWGEEIPCSTDNIIQVQSLNDNWRKGYRQKSGVFFCFFVRCFMDVKFAGVFISIPLRTQARMVTASVASSLLNSSLPISVKLHRCFSPVSPVYILDTLKLHHLFHSI